MVNTNGIYKMFFSITQNMHCLIFVFTWTSRKFHTKGSQFLNITRIEMTHRTIFILWRLIPEVFELRLYFTLCPTKNRRLEFTGHNIFRKCIVSVGIKGVRQWHSDILHCGRWLSDKKLEQGSVWMDNNLVVDH